MQVVGYQLQISAEKFLVRRSDLLWNVNDRCNSIKFGLGFLGFMFILWKDAPLNLEKGISLIIE